MSNLEFGLVDMNREFPYDQPWLHSPSGTSCHSRRSLSRNPARSRKDSMTSDFV